MASRFPWVHKGKLEDVDLMGPETEFAMGGESFSMGVGI